MLSYADFLFVTSDLDLRSELARACAVKGYECHFSSDFDEALEFFDTKKCKVIVIDVEDPDLKGLQILEWIRARNVFSQIGVFAKRTWQPALNNAFRLGATVVFSSTSCSNEDILSERLAESLRRYELTRHLAIYATPETESAKRISWVGSDPLVCHALARALSESTSLSPLLIRGESGSGKKQLAEIIIAGGCFSRIMRFTPRAGGDDSQKKQFTTLLEGLSTDDVAALLVSDIENLHPEIQELLAEALKGGGLPTSSGRFWPKLKILVTTAEDLDLLARQGRLKSDLALLLPLNSLFVPPLRERKGDLALLAAHFLEEDFAPDRVCYFSEDAMSALLAYDWPGNVAELKKMVSELAARVKGLVFKAKDLPNALLEKGFYVQDVPEEDFAELNYNQAKNLALNKFNREYISVLLSRSNNNLTVAAEIAGMDRSNFKKIVKKYFPEL